MKQVTDELLEAGIMTLLDSEYCSPFFIKRKPDRGYRSLIDFKELNKITKHIDWHFLRIDWHVGLRKRNVGLRFRRFS